MSKKLQQKQDRRRAEEERRAAQRRAHRRTNMTTLVIALVVLAIVAAAIYFQKNEPSANDVPDQVGVDAAQANCGDVEDFPDGGQDHIEVGSEHEPYNSTPPTSGPHYGSPADPGFYSQPLPPEQVVHNLEHGMIVIWYSPSAPQATIDAIEDLVAQEPNATVATPFDGIEPPNQLVLTAWQHSQSCEDVSQEVVDDIRAEFQGRGPEAVGVPVFERS